MPEIEVLTGPTASGKSSLALARALRDTSIEIVNADASAFYVGFDIGTAKASRADREQVVHHLIDIREPHVRFSAFEYSQLARSVIADILTRGKTPLVVGGTGFYIDALFDGLIPNDANEDQLMIARERAASEIKELGFDEMHQRLRESDPDLFTQINRERNPLRLQRAWEYYYATGLALGEARKLKTEPFAHRPTFTVLDIEREELWRRIEYRTRNLLALGWVEEVRSLMERGVTMEMPAMRAIGYSEIARHLAGEFTEDELFEKIVIATRQYAKRQWTWMKRYLRSEN